MKVNPHCQTEEYLDMLFSHGLLLIIAKATRITTILLLLLTIFTPIHDVIDTIHSVVYKHAPAE